MASWDILGVYPESTNGEGSYRDVEIVNAVAAYNKAVRAVQEGAKPADSNNSDSKQSGSDGKAGQQDTGGSSGVVTRDSSSSSSSSSSRGSQGPAVRVVDVGSDEQQRLPASG
jgi:hypothetical protein